jgi:hypothetical protein
VAADGVPNIGEVDKVSARALIGASFGSLAVAGTKPQRIGPTG